MQTQDPSQGAYPRFEEPNPTAGFLVNHGNPYDKTNQGYIPPPQYGQPGQPNGPQENNLIAHAEVQEIDQKLSSGCYACYDCWTYVIFIGALWVFISSIRQVFSHPIVLFNIVDFFIEAAFASVIQNVLANKKLEEAKEAWCLALTCSAFFGLITFIQRDAYVALFGSEGAHGFFAGYALYYAFVYIFPAYQIKALIERREIILKSANPYQV